jgi:hypothetical protein
MCQNHLINHRLSSSCQIFLFRLYLCAVFSFFDIPGVEFCCVIRMTLTVEMDPLASPLCFVIPYLSVLIMECMDDISDLIPTMTCRVRTCKNALTNHNIEPKKGEIEAFTCLIDILKATSNMRIITISCQLCLVIPVRHT